MLLSELPLLKKITLRIEKPWAPVGLPLDTVAVEITRSWHTAYVAFGSNLGDKKKYLDNGIQGLKDTPGCEVEAVSKFLVTEPYGGVEQDEFLNGVLRLRTLPVSYTHLSVLVSTALVESSRIRIFGFFRRARAIQSRCFWPPETLFPP